MRFVTEPARIRNTPELVAELAQEPGALGWAETCGWVPGTGHCRNRDCAAACAFYSQRDADHRRMHRWRRLRRAFRRDR